MSDHLTVKRGRPREYGFRSLPGFADPQVALAAAALDELRARVIDQIEDLPQGGLTFAPEGTNLTIGALAAHVVWAEAHWIERIAAGVGIDARAPVDLSAAVDPAGSALPRGEQVIPELDAGTLVMLCHRLRDELTLPVLTQVTDSEAVFRDKDRPVTPRGVLMHLIWHWTYHSAHIGLIREQWGSGYTWTFGMMA